MRLPARAAYAITAPETISLTIPAASVLSEQPIVAAPTFVVSAAGGTAFVRGGFLANLTQAALRSGAQPLEIVLYGDTWVEAYNDTGGSWMGRLHHETALELLRGFESLQGSDEAYGWSGVVQPALLRMHAGRVESRRTHTADPVGSSAADGLGPAPLHHRGLQARLPPPSPSSRSLLSSSTLLLFFRAGTPSTTAPRASSS